MESLEITEVLPASPELVFRALLDSEEHSAVTGAIAEIDPCIGGEFTAWDGYIRGKTLQLEVPHLIVQAWRTLDFPDDAPDSHLEILIENDPQGSKVTIRQTDIPDGQSGEYLQGWRDYYFEPLREYFQY